MKDHTPQSLCLHHIHSPVGTILAAATDTALQVLEFVDERNPERQSDRLFSRTKHSIESGRNAVIDLLESELSAYFDGTLRNFSVPIRLEGTPFQQTVWSELRKIPYGETWSYAALTRRLGDMKAIRAVARANGENRIAILVPCHRVIGSDGSLTGYAGGLWRKKKLLELEGATAPVPEGQQRLL